MTSENGLLISAGNRHIPKQNHGNLRGFRRKKGYNNNGKPLDIVEDFASESNFFHFSFFFIIFLHFFVFFSFFPFSLFSFFPFFSFFHFFHFFIFSFFHFFHFSFFFFVWCVPSSFSAPATSASRGPATSHSTVLACPLSKRISWNAPPRSRKLTRTEASRNKLSIRTKSRTLPDRDKKKLPGGQPSHVCTNLSNSSTLICGETLTTYVLPTPSRKTGKV